MPIGNYSVAGLLSPPSFLYLLIRPMDLSIAITSKKITKSILIHMKNKLFLIYISINCHISAMPRPQPMDEGEGPTTLLGLIVMLIFSFFGFVLFGHFAEKFQKGEKINYLGCSLSLVIFIGIFIIVARSCSL
jgi:hypothetical protein